MQNLKKNKDYLKVIWQKHTSINKEHFNVLKKLDKLELNKIGNIELLEDYHILAEALNKLLGVSHMVEGFTLTSEEKIRSLIFDAVKKMGREKEYNQLIADLTASTFPSFIGEAHNAIVLAAVEYTKHGKKIAKLLKQLEKKYYWLNNGYSCTHYLDADYFMHEINELVKKGITKEMENYAKNYRKILYENKKRKQQLFKELKLSDELIQLLEISDFMAKLQDNRKHVTTITLSYIDNFLAEISKRYNLKHELVRYLIQAEVTEFNLNNLTDQMLEERRAKSIFFYTYESQKEKEPEKRGIVFTGRKAEQMITQLMDEDHGEIHELKGNCASPGKVTAIVKVCRGANEIAKVQRGDILVACMTQPEFVPAMKKAAAIITDEGGLTCHAAIVSRELGIPCLIGTRKATKVLKDGMKVEVDADNGVVRILR
ncbi:hypothetical protein J4206_06280 [Candidatus Woesearchaeota archaeon]|nr:hypothetical protein [Candidatus Woesearchaeota archaeon]